jgi:hypothetical protein
MAGGWAPELTVHETGNGCRLTLAGLTYGNGSTLQEAADDLITRLLTVVLCSRSSGFRIPPGLGPPDPQLLTYLWELGDLAAAGEDIRDRVFGFVEAPDDTPA